MTPPSETQIAQLLSQAPHGHPRLCADATIFARVLVQAKNDRELALLIAKVLAQADSALNSPPVERVLVGRRMLDVSRTALLRLSALGAAWRLTGDARYAARGDRELRAICAFSDWHPEHFLDVGEMALAAALGYDWLFESLPSGTREMVRRAIVDKAIGPSFGEKPAWWVSGENNWTQVCHAGLMAGVMAISEDEPVLAARVIQRAVANLPKVMTASFAPDGAYPEGPGYWEYGATFNIIAIDLLRSRLGQDFGLSTMPGFRDTADYIAHACGPTGWIFNYGDCGEAKSRYSPARIWLARERQQDWRSAPIQDPIVDRALSRDRLLALALTWAGPAGGTPAPRALDYHGAGLKPVAMFRSAWNDPNATYLGVVGGTPSSSHGHQDAGSFVFEAKGVRWGIDLGMQSYESLESKGVGLWNGKQDGQRWSVFRLSNHGHSTLVLDGRLQQVSGFAAITTISTDAQNPGCTVDLSPLYAGQAEHVVRTFLMPQRTGLVVSDQISGVLTAGTVRWQLVTRAAVAIHEDGRHARLTQDGKTLTLTVAAPANSRLTIGDAVGPQSYDADNPGVRILAAEVNAAAGDTVNLRIVLEP